MVNAMKDAINQKLKTNFASFKVMSVKTQVVAGTNYLFQLETNDKKKVEVKIFRPLPHKNEPNQVTEAKLIWTIWILFVQAQDDLYTVSIIKVLAHIPAISYKYAFYIFSYI